MLKIEIEADEAALGKMTCHWEEDAALMTIRGFLEKLLFRNFCEEYERKTGDKFLSEAEIQWTLDVLSVEALRLLEEYAQQIFHLAQNQVVNDVFLEVRDIALSLIKVQVDTVDDAGKVIESWAGAWGEMKGMEKFREVRNHMARVFKRIHNERIGVKRGHKAGKKYKKPREMRDVSAERKSKTLAAMREIGKEPIHRKDVAPRVGVSAKTLGQWFSKEEWDSLIAEARSIGSRK